MAAAFHDRSREKRHFGGDVLMKGFLNKPHPPTHPTLTLSSDILRNSPPASTFKALQMGQKSPQRTNTRADPKFHLQASVMAADVSARQQRVRHQGVWVGVGGWGGEMVLASESHVLLKLKLMSS